MVVLGLALSIAVGSVPSESLLCGWCSMAPSVDLLTSLGEGLSVVVSLWGR